MYILSTKVHQCWTVLSIFRSGAKAANLMISCGSEMIKMLSSTSDGYDVAYSESADSTVGPSNETIS